jgi:hypothetical protein
MTSMITISIETRIALTGWFQDDSLIMPVIRIIPDTFAKEMVSQTLGSPGVRSSEASHCLCVATTLERQHTDTIAKHAREVSNNGS